MTRAQTVLAFDFGLKRIGIACGDTLTRSAAPRPAAAAVRGNPDWQAIAREVRALTPGVLVVGAPYNVEGRDGGECEAGPAAERRLAASPADARGPGADTDRAPPRALPGLRAPAGGDTRHEPGARRRDGGEPVHRALHPHAGEFRAGRQAP